MPDRPIQPGCRVTLHFRLALAEGAVADESGPDEPLEFIFGSGELAPGLEAHLLGLKAGDQRQVRIAAGEVFGLPDPGNIHHLPRSDFPPDMALAPGTVVGFTSPSGQEIAGVVQDVSEARVAVDFSHPLSGHDLAFDVEILAVEPPAI